jgi:hypothetical protein
MTPSRRVRYAPGPARLGAGESVSHPFDDIILVIEWMTCYNRTQMTGIGSLTA